MTMKKLNEYFPKRMDYVVTLQGLPLFSFFIAQCQDGITTGIGVDGIGDVHITNLDKNDRISWHITDKNIKQEAAKELKNPYGGHQPKKAFADKYEKMMKKYLVPYHPNRKVWVVSPDYLMKIYGVGVTADNNFLPLELLMGKIEFNPKDSSKWIKIRIRELWSYRVPFGIIIDDNKIKYVRPLDRSQMLCFTWRQFSYLINRMMALFGFDEYLNYLKEKRDAPTIFKQLLEDRINKPKKD